MTADPVIKTVRRSADSERIVVGVHTLTASDIVVGKDILELVSSAMYVDPMTIYREYVQNAADAIDEARRSNVLRSSDPGRVDIEIDSEKRRVRIRDNGSGIAWPDFARRLTALGASSKRGTASRGFRGVGRLSGLGYAQELIFRSRTLGEPHVSELRWDCRQLRAALRAIGTDNGLTELIRTIVTVRQISADTYPRHFFEVELNGIVRLRGDRLMSPSAAKEYLSQVAPVPFSPDFRFRTEINEALRAVGNLGELEIRIASIDGLVYRPHRDAFAVGNGREIAFESLDVVEIPGIDGGVAGVAWILHHEYEGALPTATLFKGLRLRAGNMQVGDHVLLEDSFSEPRFNSWSVGEVHAIDRRIVPNGRRDHFEQNAHLANLLNHLAPTIRDIARRCRTSSIRRKWLRDFQQHKTMAKEKIGIIAQGTLGASRRSRLTRDIERTLATMDRIAGKEWLAQEPHGALQSEVQKLKGKLEKLTNSKPAPVLARFSKSQRAMYERLFELIYECSVNRVAAKALIDRILLKLS